MDYRTPEQKEEGCLAGFGWGIFAFIVFLEVMVGRAP